jgi:DNA-directed RNA polymerase specialized sigma24 family protein
MEQSAEEQFEEIYDRHHDAVERYARRRMPADLVEDVVAETFLVCWRRLDDVPAEALPWLYAVARKTIANQRRAAVRRTAAPVDVAAAGPEPVGDPQLAAAFAGLSDRDREVLRLVAWEGLSIGQASNVLGCTAVSCRVRFHRAKRRLAALLDTATAAVSTRPRPEGAIR